jgi:hypothetical protein
MGKKGSFSEKKAAGFMKLAAYSHLVPRWRISVTTHTLHRTNCSSRKTNLLHLSRIISRCILFHSESKPLITVNYNGTLYCLLTTHLNL